MDPNITKAQNTEEALRESERLYRAIGESINYGVWVCAPDGRNTYASPSFLKLVGITQQQCSDFGWGDVLHPEDAERTIAAWQDCVRAEGNWDIEHRFRGVEGQWHPVLARGVPVRNEAGDLTCWAGINLDISRLKRVEESLRQSQAQLRMFIRTAPISIAIFDRDMNYLATSDRWLSDYSRGDSDVIGKNHYQAIPDISAEWKAIHQQGLAGATVTSDEDLWLHADGSKHWLRWAVVPWIDEKEVIGGIIISTEDITERKLAEEGLKVAKAEAERRERLTRTMLNALPASVAVLNRNGVITEINDQWRRFSLENSPEPGRPARHTAVGVNYLDICARAVGDSAELADEARAGCRATNRMRVARQSG